MVGTPPHTHTHKPARPRAPPPALDEDGGSDDDGVPAAAAPRPSASQRAADGGGGDLLTESIRPRAGLPPLLVNLAERWAAGWGGGQSPG